MKRIALFPGTFDPPTYAHLNIIEKAAQLCDKLYVGLGINLAKQHSLLFSLEDRKHFLIKMTETIPHVEVVPFPELVVHIAKHLSVQYLIRGLHPYSNFNHEMQMAAANRKLSGLETLFILSDEKYAYISSSLVREIANCKGNLLDFIPHTIEPLISQKLKL